MGRSFYSAAYQPAVTIVEAPTDAHPEPARWADAQFDPDADAFFNAADAVHEEFLSAEEALARAQADVAAARAARFENSPSASADTSGAGTPTSEHAATAQAWQNGQWTTLFAEMSEPALPAEAIVIAQQPHVMPDWVSVRAATPPPLSPDAVWRLLATQPATPQTPLRFAGSPSSATPRVYAWHGPPPPPARLSRAHVAPAIMAVPHMLG